MRVSLRYGLAAFASLDWFYVILRDPWQGAAASITQGYSAPVRRKIATVDI